MDAKSEKLAVDIRQAAYLISVSSRTIQNYIRAKVLPARKIGRRTLITVRALERFLRADQPSPVTETTHDDSND
jgi:excisionase family DNA binding protein